jgi:hypothetical protein
VSSLVSTGPFQVICKYSSDENFDNQDFDSIEAEIKDKYFGDQVTFYTIRPGHDNMEKRNRNSHNLYRSNYRCFSGLNYFTICPQLRFI